MSQQLTQEQISEIVACRTDPIHFILKYCKIRHPERGIISFDLYQFQKNILEKLILNRFTIILKSRQMGISTLMAAYCTWLACFFNAKEILILANKGSVASGLIKKCKLILEDIPAWLIPQQLNDNAQSIQLSNYSVISASTTTSDSARSSALSLLIFDEASLVKDHLIKDVWQSARPTLATGGSAVILSTPRGIGNFFHTMWMKAEQGESDGDISFFPIKLHWSLHPERDAKWEEQERAAMSNSQFETEYGVSFEKSGNTIIEANIIDWYEKNHIKDPTEREAFDHNYWIWKRSEIGKNYIVCADVARGDGSDFSTLHVICIEDMEQVAEYRGKLPPVIFGELLVKVGRDYNTAMIICENNSVGYASIQKCLDAMYPKVYWSKRTEGQLFFDPLNWHLPGPDKIPGFTTSQKNRLLIINSFEEALRTKQFIFHSSRLINEIKGFIWVNTGVQVRAQAAPSMNDDLIMALAIGLFARSTTLRLTTSDTIQVNALLDSISVSKGVDTKLSEASIQQESVNKSKNPFMWNGIDLVHLTAD